MGFYVRYCDKKLRYVGLCTIHPLYSSFGDTPEEAMQGIIGLVKGLDLDSAITDVFWPPWKDLL